MLKCSTCDKRLIIGNIKYHTPDNMHVFCDAYCSNEWYSRKLLVSVWTDGRKTVKVYAEVKEK